MRKLSILGLLWLTASLALAQHSVTLAWAPSVIDATHDAPTNYNIKRSLTAGDCTALKSTCIQVGSVSASTFTFTDTAVNAGQQFVYVITAQNNVGESAPTPEVSVTIPSFLPATPGKPTTVVK